MVNLDWVNEKNTMNRHDDEKRSQGGSAPMTSKLHFKSLTTSLNITRQDRGKAIAQAGNQIRRIDDHTYTVQSPSNSNKTYDICHTECG